MKFRIVYTDKSNTLEAGKNASQIDESLFSYGKYWENKPFKQPYGDGSKDLLQAWRKECGRLNKKYPALHHWVDTEQPIETMLYNSEYLNNIRIFGYKDWRFCLAYWPTGEPMKIGAGAIQLRIENGWNPEIQTPSLVVLEREGTRVLYEKIEQ